MNTFFIFRSHVFFYLQGCVAGGLLGLTLAMWVSIGAYSLPRKGYPLDFPTENCSVAEVVTNATGSVKSVTLYVLFT